MDPSAQEAYLAAYELAMSRHGLRSTMSATQTPVLATGSVEAAASKTAEMGLLDVLFGLLLLLWSLLAKIIITLWWYIVFPALVFGILFGAVQWKHWSDVLLWQPTSVIQSHIALRQRCTALLRWLHDIVMDLRFNWFTDMVYIRYQRLVFWIGDRKLLILAILLALWYASAYVEKHKSMETEKFVGWQEIQRYLDTPIPEVLTRPRKEYGSNSHYLRKPEIATGHDEWYGAIMSGDARESDEIFLVDPVVSAESRTLTSVKEEQISAARMATRARQPDSASYRQSQETEKVRWVVGPDNVWCRDCRQWHCCELQY